MYSPVGEGPSPPPLVVQFPVTPAPFSMEHWVPQSQPLPLATAADTALVPALTLWAKSLREVGKGVLGWREMPEGLFLTWVLVGRVWGQGKGAPRRRDKQRVGGGQAAGCHWAHSLGYVGGCEGAGE